MPHTNDHFSRRRRRRRALAVAAAGLLIGLGAAGTAAAAGEEAGAPCSAAADACVDLATSQAWLMEDGEVTYGPVDVAHGATGTPTPTGGFTVYDKDRDHYSAEFDGAPMPWSVFFAPGGVAFHEGKQRTGSAGCVKLDRNDAVAFYGRLEEGDRVEVR